MAWGTHTIQTGTYHGIMWNSKIEWLHYRLKLTARTLGHFYTVRGQSVPSTTGWSRDWDWIGLLFWDRFRKQHNAHYLFNNGVRLLSVLLELKLFTLQIILSGCCRYKMSGVQQVRAARWHRVPPGYVPHQAPAFIQRLVHIFSFVYCIADFFRVELR